MFDSICAAVLTGWRPFVHVYLFYAIQTNKSPGVRSESNTYSKQTKPITLSKALQFLILWVVLDTPSTAAFLPLTMWSGMVKTFLYFHCMMSHTAHTPSKAVCLCTAWVKLKMRNYKPTFFVEFTYTI